VKYETENKIRREGQGLVIEPEELFRENPPPRAKIKS
jgi:hypothetical protein